jgi:hypothetical protein
VNYHAIIAKRCARIAKQLKAALLLSTTKSSAAIVTNTSSNVIAQLTQLSQVDKQI